MPSKLVDLLDLNVWVAMCDKTHVHHQRAQAYWQNEASSGVVFCRTTMLGFMRHLTSKHVMAGNPFTPEEAWRRYRNFLRLPEISFLDEPQGIDSQMALWSDRPVFQHHLWTDAYLAAFAIISGCRVVSFDGDFKHFNGLAFLHLKA